MNSSLKREINFLHQWCNTTISCKRLSLSEQHLALNCFPFAISAQISEDYMSSAHLHKNSTFRICEVGNLLPKLFSFPNLMSIIYMNETTLAKKKKKWKLTDNGSAMEAWIYPTISPQKGNGKKMCAQWFKRQAAP